MSKSARGNRTVLVLAGGLSILACGCGPSDDSGGDLLTEVHSALGNVTFSLPVFVGENPSDVALAASSSLYVNDRALAIELATGDRAMVSNVGTTDLSTVVGLDASVGTVLSGGQVFLRFDASVSGSLYQGGSTPGPANQGSFFVSGVTQAKVTGFTADATWTRTVVWPTMFNATPNLEPGQLPTVVALAPGAYHSLDVKTGRTLKLTVGEYFLDQLVIEPGAGLQIDGSAGAVLVDILDGGLIFRGSMAGGINTPNLSFPSLTVMTTGSVDLEQPFTGVVIAPNGFVDLKANVNTNDPKSHFGAFFGKAVTLYEGNRVFHYRDPFSFRGFGPADGSPFIGDRASVTGGSIRRPGGDITDEAYQGETVTAVSRNGSAFVVTVGYNDSTVSRTNPSIVYPDGRGTVNGVGGMNRTINPGTSLLGWSFSTDGGHTFNYGGRVVPPAGRFIWSDPAIAKLNIDDPNVYYAQIAGSTTQPILTNGGDNVNLVNALNGYCIARSTDRGQTFPSVACLTDVFQDGTALAVALDAANRRQVYVTGATTRVWRMDGESMVFASSPLPDPMPDRTEGVHPRMAVFGGMLYILRQDTNRILANRLDAKSNATSWLGETQLVLDASSANLSVDTSPGISFDFGPGLNGQTMLRVMYTAFKPAAPHGSGIKVIECDLCANPSTCQASTWASTCKTLPWSTLSEAGQEGGPSLRFGGGQWVAAWRKNDSGALIRTVAARLVPGGSTLDERTLYQSLRPCAYGGNRWGEYNLIDGFADGRFFVPYTVNGPGCRWQGSWTADSHVGGFVFGF